MSLLNIPKEKYKVFLCHSLKDKRLTSNILKIFANSPIALQSAEHIFNGEKTVLEKIKHIINDCPLAIVLLTDKAYRSPFVHQEIGYIEALGKKTIVIKYPNLKGFLYGKSEILSWASPPSEKLQKKVLDIFGIPQIKIENTITEINEAYPNLEKDTQDISISLALIAILCILAQEENSNERNGQKVQQLNEKVETLEKRIEESENVVVKWNAEEI